MGIIDRVRELRDRERAAAKRQPRRPPTPLKDRIIEAAKDRGAQLVKDAPKIMRKAQRGMVKLSKAGAGMPSPFEFHTVKGHDPYRESTVGTTVTLMPEPPRRSGKKGKRRKKEPTSFLW